jgi:quinol monooxygenase YgiN
VVIVAGHIVVDPEQRDDYLSGCVEVVRQARRAPGCLDFSLSADLLEPGRINILERWESQAAVEAFRGSGPSDEQGAAVLAAAVAEYDVGDERSLT